MILMRYWLGSKGPLIYRSKSGELPLRIELVKGGEEMSVAINVPSSIAGSSGGNIENTVSAADYAAYRASHFYAFHQGADML